MLHGHKGMRKGISLVEMLTAIILFGLISVISYNYYKNYYDTTFAAKQTRVYAIIDQGTQISNAYDLYSSKMGVAPTTISQIVDQHILSKVPDLQKELTTTGWVLDGNITTDNNATNGNVVGFNYVLNGTMTQQDRVDYCNILNNAAKSDYNLSTTAANIKTDTNSSYADINNTMFCYAADVNASTVTFTFVTDTE
jgi:hypothetical protein